MGVIKYEDILQPSVLIKVLTCLSSLPYPHLTLSNTGIAYGRSRCRILN